MKSMGKWTNSFISNIQTVNQFLKFQWWYALNPIKRYNVNVFDIWSMNKGKKLFWEVERHKTNF